LDLAVSYIVALFVLNKRKMGRYTQPRCVKDFGLFYYL
jgi:hypothetical protein